jgi:hypothetical protein
VKDISWLRFDAQDNARTIHLMFGVTIADTVLDDAYKIARESPNPSVHVIGETLAAAYDILAGGDNLASSHAGRLRQYERSLWRMIMATCIVTVIDESEVMSSALDTFIRALGPRANGLKFIDGMTVPTRIKPCAGTRRRRNAVKARRRNRNA